MAELPITLLKRSAAYLVSKRKKKNISNIGNARPPPGIEKVAPLPNNQLVASVELKPSEMDHTRKSQKKNPKTTWHLGENTFKKIHGMVMKPTSHWFLNADVRIFFVWSIRCKRTWFFPAKTTEHLSITEDVQQVRGFHQQFERTMDHGIIETLHW